MMRIKIYPYKPASVSAKELSQALGVRRIRHEGSRFAPREEDIIINWGASELPEELSRATVLNVPHVIRTVSNKLSFFRSLGELENIPEWTEDIEEARQWSRDGGIVVCRTVLNGHSGRGITIAETEEGLIPAPLYVKYKKKIDEYRIHITKGEIFDVQRKARRRDVEEPNWRVRNYENGFIYQRNDIEIPEACRTVALDIFLRTGLDFGAVDVIFNSNEQRAYVLEINTAPGLTGSTLDNYVQMFNKILYPNE